MFCPKKKGYFPLLYTKFRESLSPDEFRDEDAILHNLGEITLHFLVM
jgi:hypothetical protein